MKVHPPFSSPRAGEFTTLKDFLREQELAHVNHALAQTYGDKEKAAELLGISVATLYRKLGGEDADF